MGLPGRLLPRRAGAFIFDLLQKSGVVLLVDRQSLDNREMTDWYEPWFYQTMENDEVRNDAYRKAIRTQLAGKSVLEIGTGPHAFLSRMCIEAGAGRIIAIEANPTVWAQAREFVNRGDMGSRITVLRGMSQDVEIVDRSEALVHEVVGSIGSCEGMAFAVHDAKQRGLIDDPIFVPQSCTTLFFPVGDLPLRLLDRMVSATVRRFKSANAPGNYRIHNFRPAWALAEAQEFEHLAFDSDFPLSDARELVFETTRHGAFDGFAFFIRLTVGPGLVVDSLRQRTSWSIPYVRLLERAVPVAPGDRIPRPRRVRPVDVESRLRHRSVVEPWPSRFRTLRPPALERRVTERDGQVRRAPN